ncbi:uncharacterized protein BDZ83DRAFT_45908 [Colletotrichum acutatum]|uniref:Uncharacterized protein n=1 Tax=Glomerella acutata TaxID=27357 RepID=A0AAD8UFA1_GLOAC|nr:uncharacterized protein BDZ83DRAFT_45908 [Colletotrichum acutatum]KAK1716062.1 hypothetical protein BDZ83DRAFT_45908 [Colletotrichum acutatum]
MLIDRGVLSRVCAKDWAWRVSADRVGGKTRLSRAGSRRAEFGYGCFTLLAFGFVPPRSSRVGHELQGIRWKTADPSSQFLVLVLLVCSFASGPGAVESWAFSSVVASSGVGVGGWCWCLVVVALDRQSHGEEEKMGAGFWRNEQMMIGPKGMGWELNQASQARGNQPGTLAESFAEKEKEKSDNGQAAYPYPIAMGSGLAN